MNKYTTTCLAALFSMGSTAAMAAPVSLNTWADESYPAVSGFPEGDWQVAPDGASVTQQQNGQATIFYSDFFAQGSKVTGSITVTSGGDDDFIGFVLGFDPGDTLSTTADYLLVDWKAANQTFDFGGGSAGTTTGGVANAGLAVSRVTGIPTADELWQHSNQAGNPGGGVEELGRATTLGSTGWVRNQTYEFSFDFGPNNLVIEVDGVQQFALTGDFENGRMGFYNFSQDIVVYSAFEQDEGTFPSEVPLPAAGWLLLAGFGGLAALRRRKTA